MSWGRPTLFALATLLSIGVALGSYRYFLGIGMIPDVAGNPFARPWLLVHVGGAATALLLGPLNLISALRRRRPSLHRWIGRVYILACLAGGAAGLPLAFGSFAGPIATLGFASLAVLWLLAAWEGWRAARERRFADHRAWMIRSFAMTFGAVTLRLQLAGVQVSGLPFLPAYRAISFLAWVPNLLIAEAYLRGAFDEPLGRTWRWGRALLTGGRPGWLFPRGR